MAEWETLGGVDPRRLTEARLQLHWAAQAASAVGKQLLKPQPDGIQQSFVWSPRQRALAQGVVSGEQPFRAALRLGGPALALLDPAGATLAELPLGGRTLAEAYVWLEERIADLLGHTLREPLERPGEILPHPVAKGAPFCGDDRAAFAEIARWFADADLLLRAVAAREGGSAVRCWPHHFDLATLATLAGEGETARTIGVGLSPGDAGRPEPYFYVTPWPYPEHGDLPELPAGGIWHTDGWVGAVLAAPALLAGGPDDAQESRADRFLRAAIAACRSSFHAQA